VLPTAQWWSPAPPAGVLRCVPDELGAALLAALDAEDAADWLREGTEAPLAQIEAEAPRGREAKRAAKHEARDRFGVAANTRTGRVKRRAEPGWREALAARRGQQQGRQKQWEWQGFAVPCWRRENQIPGSRLDRIPKVRAVAISVAGAAHEPCAICRERCGNSRLLLHLCCGHLFHLSCIAHWLTNYARTCPLDRKRVG